jgi:hypothetical protein
MPQAYQRNRTGVQYARSRVWRSAGLASDNRTGGASATRYIDGATGATLVMDGDTLAARARFAARTMRAFCAFTL